MKLPTFLIILFYMSAFLAACGGEVTAVPTEAPAITPTPDPCSSANLPAEVAQVNKLMREFDDYSALASNTPQSQMVLIIPELQRVLRDAEDQVVPACLQDLKELQINHMTIVVQTLMAFMSNSDVNLVNAGISKSRELHAQYDIELARLLGLTLTIPPSPTPGLATADANATPTSPATAPAITAVNPGPSGVNLRNAPDLNAPEVGILSVQMTATALGRTADNLWVLVEIPGQPGQSAWVYAALVQLSAPIDQLTVVTP